VIALVFPAYYDIAFSFAQPVVLGEMAFALWLLIKGPNVQALAPAATPNS